LDPIYVVIDVGIDGVRGALVGALAGYPPVGPPIHNPLAPQDGSNFVFRFNNVVDSNHFIGWMQRAIPGLRCWVFNTAFVHTFE